MLHDPPVQLLDIAMIWSGIQCFIPPGYADLPAPLPPKR